MNYSKAQAGKQIRKAAKDVGLTFKITRTRLNGTPLYELVVRKTGEVVMSNYQFWTAYNDFCSGYIQSWNGQTFNSNREI
jgi:G:T-mismatch repair DNA endonuclease (very short patch repair protein)